jgi:hypothetical protein
MVENHVLGHIYASRVIQLSGAVPHSAHCVYASLNGKFHDEGSISLTQNFRYLTAVDFPFRAQSHWVSGLRLSFRI